MLRGASVGADPGLVTPVPSFPERGIQRPHLSPGDVHDWDVQRKVRGWFIRALTSILEIIKMLRIQEATRNIMAFSSDSRSLSRFGGRRTDTAAFRHLVRLPLSIRGPTAQSAPSQHASAILPSKPVTLPWCTSSRREDSEWQPRQGRKRVRPTGL